MTGRTNGIKQNYRVDVLSMILVTALVLFGLITLLHVLSDPFDGTESTFSAFLERLNFEYFSRQAANVALSLCFLLPFAIVDYEKYKPFTMTAYLVCLLLLGLLVLAGESTRGALGWYRVGTRAFQPSEIAKVVLIIMLSKVASEQYERNGPLRKPLHVGICLLYFLIPFVLVLLQRDFGTAMVLLVIFCGILFCVRLHWLYVAGGLSIGAVMSVVGWLFLLSETQKERIRVFLDPSRDPLGEGLNVLHAKQVIGSGGMFGKGYFTKGTLIQTGYVPEWHTDFIFSGIGEGIGFLGAAIVVLIYFLLLFHWLRTALNARDTFGRCLVVGCTVMLAAHVFENIGMNLGAMPVTGIPLPFISYGGSNMLASLCCVGIVMSVYARSAGRRRQL